MNSSVALVATVALTLPIWGNTPLSDAFDRDDVAIMAVPDDHGASPLGYRAPPPEGFANIGQIHVPPVEQQVRIEQRVIIRISPSQPDTLDQFFGELPRRPVRETFVEQVFDGCVPVNQIAGVQAVPQNRLLLFMQDRRVLSASLERSCNAAEFYSGFYVEQQSDGALCSGRDRLQSRTGASCEVVQFHRVVAVRE